MALAGLCAAAGGQAEASHEAIDLLTAYLQIPRAERSALSGQTFAKTALTREDTDRALRLLWADHACHLRQSRSAEMAARRLTIGELAMPFYYSVSGDRPENGRSLYISMHGGGGTARQVNDGQWENQKKLYRVPEGVYVAPRAPNDAWNMWFQGHMDGLFERLIENMIVFEEVDPDRVYLLGYSAGGDGVYQLGPRMADRWAAAAMMAGHERRVPGESL